MSYSVIIPSANPSNLKACVNALLHREPTLTCDRIIVIWDGPTVPFHLPVNSLQGRKPFVFARNVNIGIAAAGQRDVILLNDDALLKTDQGFSLLSAQVRMRPKVGACSAAITGTVCNRRQRWAPGGFFRTEPHLLAFVCVYLPRAVLTTVGGFDERFNAYGFEDFDYCNRIRRAGYDLAIWDGCLVDHAQLPSTFRTRPDIAGQLARGREIYEAKWGAP